MNNELVSIVIPSYNHEKFINDSIDGILNQTYENIELIVADDQSVDSTFEVLMSRKQDLYNKCKNVVIYKNESNLGISKSLNRAISKSAGKYIKVIASDDILCKDGIEKLVNYRYKINETCFIHTSEYFISVNDDYDSITKNTNSINKSAHCKYVDNCYQNLLKHGCFILAPTTFYDKEIFVKLGGYDEKICVEDFPFYIKVSKHYPIYFLDEETVFYRLVNTNKKSDNRINQLIDCYSYVLDNYSDDMDKLSRNKYIFRSIEMYNQAIDKSISKQKIVHIKTKYKFNDINYLFYNFYYNFIAQAKSSI